MNCTKQTQLWNSSVEGQMCPSAVEPLYLSQSNTAAASCVLDVSHPYQVSHAFHINLADILYNANKALDANEDSYYSMIRFYLCLQFIRCYSLRARCMC